MVRTSKREERDMDSLSGEHVAAASLRDEDDVLAKALSIATRDLIQESEDAKSWTRMPAESFEGRFMALIGDETLVQEVSQMANWALRVGRSALREYLLLDPARAERIARAYLTATREFSEEARSLYLPRPAVTLVPALGPGR
jgi:hypothetical protein